MAKHEAWTFQEIIFACLAVLFVLVLHLALPGWTIPTLGQAVWSMGFAESFANGALFDFYAHDFGIPKPAAIAFGLAGAWPASLLIRLGLHAADAYAMMVAMWLCLAMFAAYQIARQFGAARIPAWLGAVAWMSMPIIWAHAGYSMLSLGIALLPFYFLAAIHLFLLAPQASQVKLTDVLCYFAATIIAVFMDGYTFMMFAVGASMLLIHALITQPQHRSALRKMALPTHIASFAVAYLLYSTYIGEANFGAHSIDFFRGWGLDLSFLTIPTKGVHWLPDILGLSQARSDATLFGDGSVWGTTFALPIVVLGLHAWWRTKKKIKIASAVFYLAMFGFYMALGPSLKVNSTKPQALQVSHPHQQSALMPAELALLPTGNAWMSKTLPGFNVMRAAYRWMALGVFGFWLLLMIQWGQQKGGQRCYYALALLGLILFNLPDIKKHWQGGLTMREMFHAIDEDLIRRLRQHIQAGERVAFIPWGNDFIANYLAPKADFRTFNIGGDKNLAAAQMGWPAAMLGAGGELTPSKASSALLLLLNDDVDAIVLPYFNMLWSPHHWPCPAKADDKDFSCLDVLRAELQSVILPLRALPHLIVTENPLFATVRLRPEMYDKAGRAALIGNLYRNIKYPLLIGASSGMTTFMLETGWHAAEAHHVWSRASATLRLPVPGECLQKKCDAALKFMVFGASAERPVRVIFEIPSQQGQLPKTIVASSGESIIQKVPLKAAHAWQALTITVPDATSPEKLNGSADPRVFGIALQEVDLVQYETN